MTDKEYIEFADILLFRGKMICHDCFNQMTEKDRKGRVARPWYWLADQKPNACCSKCGREGYHDDADE